MEKVKVFGLTGDNYPVDQQLFDDACTMFGLDPTKQVLMLPYSDAVGREIRHYYFGLAIGPDGLLRDENIITETPVGSNLLDHLQVTRIFSFGDCNVACPYCKRDCQFIDHDGTIIGTTYVALIDLFRMAERAVAHGEVVRFSGGDPVMFRNECLAISWYVHTRYGAKTSIAHNGSGPAWVKQMLPFMESAAIDLKAVPEKLGFVMGVKDSAGIAMYKKSLQTQRLFSNPETNPNGAILDVRTPIFGDTTLSEMMRLGYDIGQNDPRTTFWTWRLYKPVHGCDWSVPEKERVTEMLLQVSAAYPNHWMGIRAKWHGGGMLYVRGGQIVNPAEELETVEAVGSGNLGNKV